MILLSSESFEKAATTPKQRLFDSFFSLQIPFFLF